MTEVRALLLTDVVDSTQLAACWATRDGRCVGRARPPGARPAAAAWRGREIDKTDGMLLMFEPAGRRGALRAAYHRRWPA
jgi:hypothetical protein